MKNMKKLASLILALVMVFSLATTAFAADDGDTDNGKITINEAIAGQTYTIYQILDLESYNETAKAYSYKATAEWKSFVEGTSVKDIYLVTDDQGYVTWKEGADVAEFAKLAKTFAASLTSNQGQKVAESTTVIFDNLDLGYYLIDTTLGTICSLDTTNNEVTMEEKNEAPTSDKKVEEDSKPNQWGTENDADIGQTVNYKSEIGVKAGAVNYTFRDTMSAGLTLDASSIKVQVDGADVAAANYTLKTGDEAGDYTFTIAFDNTWIATQTGKTIVITYSATVNENAVVAGTGNTNKASLEYGNKTDKDSTPESTTVTKTWKFDVEKFTYVTTKGEDGTETRTEQKLAGATFTLSKKNDGTDPIKFVKVSDNVYRVAKENETGAITEITTDATGKFTLQGLDSDTYYLTETKAPAGYNKLPAAIKVTIDSNGNVTKDTDTTALADGLVKVENKSGTELPSTGGMGTTIFYVLGAVLMLGAAVILITKRRMSVR